jgi:hypothetical protein
MTDFCTYRPFVSRVIVALAIERLVAIKYPLWSKHVCSVINARRIILLVLVFTMFIQSYHFLIKGLDCKPSSMSKNNDYPCRCKTLREYVEIDVILTIYLWRLILMTLVPLATIITVNVLIMSQLFNGDSLVDQMHASENTRRKRLLLHKISRMLVIVSSIYLILHVPGSASEIMKFMFIHVFKICNKRWQYYIYLTHDIFDLLTNFNYGINFFLYIISGKHIRNELIRTFRGVKRRASTDSYYPGHYQRSSVMASSYGHAGKHNQPARQSIVHLSRRATGSSV